MKKIFLPVITILIIALAGCNPMADIYKQLEAQKKPFSKTIEYTLTDEDYNTIASVSLIAAENAEDTAACEAIKTYHSFAETRPGPKFIPPFLSYKFPALDSGSIAKITYNYDHSYVFPYAQTITLPSNVYSNLGVSALDDQNNKPEVVVPDFLNSTDLYDSYDRLVVKFNYDDGDKVYEHAIYCIKDAGSWIAPDDQYVYRPEDYETMGGTAAEKHYFTADYPPNTYIPNFLKTKFIYAQPGDVKQVLYKYNYGDWNTKYHYNKFFFDGQNWNYLEQKTEQYMHKGELGWKFDPTVKYEMSCSDYQIIVNWVKDNMPEYMHPIYSTSEYYFGASSYYCNFDMRLTTRRSRDSLNLLPADDNEAMIEIWQRLDQAIAILLEAKFPNAQPELYGVPVYYEVTFSTYEPARHKYMIKFLCTDIGQFTPVDQEGAIEYNSHIVLVQ